MVRYLIIALLIAVMGIGSVPILIDTASVEVAAQTRKAKRQRPTLFQRLFGVRDRVAPTIRRKFRKKKRRPRQPPVVTAEIQPKAPDARKILIVGDFVAGGVAWGLEQAFAEEPKLTVIDKSKAKLRALQEKASAKAESLTNECKAKLDKLDAKISKATAETKAKFEKRRAELKADYDERVAKLKKASELTASALTP